jgi:hypothetical protein
MDMRERVNNTDDGWLAGWLREAKREELRNEKRRGEGEGKGKGEPESWWLRRTSAIDVPS